MKNVYLIQIPVQFVTDLTDCTTLPVYFPYSVGLLWSYACTFDTVKNNFCLRDFICLKKSHDEIINSLKDPDVIGISCYIWNMNFSMELARRIKIKFPNCIILAGGPSVPVDDDNFFVAHPYLDILSYREGEISVKNIFLALGGEITLDEVDGIAYNKNGQLIRTGPPVRVENLDEIPSPYLAGLFDNLVVEFKKQGIKYNALLETNRGCPFACTYCDWGSGTLGKVKKFDLRRVKKELLWMARNGVEYIGNCDANFGAFKERDLEITKWLVKLKKRYGYPQTFDTNWHKNNNQSTVELAKMLMDGGLLRRFTSSLQSMNEEALTAVKRKNLSDRNIKQIVNFARAQGIQTATDLIVGLPGETYDSFQNAYVYLIETGMLPGVSPLEILPNSEMNQTEYRKTHGLITKKFAKEFTYTAETQELVIGTNTMSVAEYERLLLWTWFVHQMHFHGYTNLIYDYFHRTQGWNLKIFYEKLLTLFLQQRNLEPNNALLPYKNHVNDGLSNQLTLGSVNNDIHNRIGATNREKFYLGLKELIKDLSNIDNKILDDLILLQDYNQAALQREQLELITCNSNLYGFIYHNESLALESTKYLVEHAGINLTTYGHYGAYLVSTRFSHAWRTKIIKYAPDFGHTEPSLDKIKEPLLVV
jgi:putative methyltransferase